MAHASANTLAEAIRLLASAGLLDYNGHCSLRTGPNSLLINTRKSVRARVTAADLVEIDLDGHILDGGDPPPNEVHIHAEIYRARPDVGAVFHGHPKWSTVLSSAGIAYTPVFAQGVLPGDVPLYADPMSINTREAGARVADTLGAGRAVVLRAHGLVVAGSDLLETFALANYIEENAERQFLALQVGRPYVFSAEEQAICRQNLWKPSLFAKVWEHARTRLAPPPAASEGNKE